MDTKQKLDQIAEYEAQRDLLEMERQQLIDDALPPEIKQRMTEINDEFAGKIDAVGEKLTTLKAEITDEVLASGATIRGAHIMAVFNKGRVSWDGAKLDGMMSIIPALKDARKEGKPSISFRAIEK